MLAAILAMTLRTWALPSNPLIPLAADPMPTPYTSAPITQASAWRAL